MKKQDYINSVLYFAKKYNLENTYTELIYTSKITMPELNKMIILLLFVNEFNQTKCLSEEHGHYFNILNYQKTIQTVGFFEFND